MSTSKAKKHRNRLKNDPRYRRNYEKYIKKYGKRIRLEEQDDLWEQQAKIDKIHEENNKIQSANEGVSQDKQYWLKNRAKELNNDLPKSEIWFYEQLKKFHLHKLDFTKNFPLGNYIFDLKYKEILIEIDGSIHDLPEQKERDRLKNDFVINHTDFLLIRVNAYDEGSLNDCIEKLLYYKTRKDTIKY